MTSLTASSASFSADVPSWYSPPRLPRATASTGGVCIPITIGSEAVASAGGSLASSMAANSTRRTSECCTEMCAPFWASVGARLTRSGLLALSRGSWRLTGASSSHSRGSASAASEACSEASSDEYRTCSAQGYAEAFEEEEDDEDDDDEDDEADNEAEEDEEDEEEEEEDAEEEEEEEEEPEATPVVDEEAGNKKKKEKAKGAKGATPAKTEDRKPTAAAAASRGPKTYVSLPTGMLLSVRCPVEGVSTLDELRATLRGGIARHLRAEGDAANAAVVDEAEMEIEYLASLESPPEVVGEGTDLSVLSLAKAIKVGLVTKEAAD